MTFWFHPCCTLVLVFSFTIVDIINNRRCWLYLQFLREQDLLMRERERRIEMEKADRERSLHPHPSPGSQPHIPSVTNKYHDGEPQANLYRPYQSITNGFERNHFTDYERRLMNENILAHDRQMLQTARIQSSRPPASSKDTVDHIASSAVDSKSTTLKIPDHVSIRNANNHHHPHVSHPTQLPHYQSSNQTAKKQPEVEYGNHLSYSRHSSSSQPTAPQSHDLRTTDHHTVPTSTAVEQSPRLLYSKLDLEEQHLREARINGTYDSDASDAEDDVEDAVERKRQSLLLITTGPPLKLDKTRTKVSFLQQYGLTTQTVRKELDYERLSKHRKIYKEPVVSPVLEAEVKESRPVMLRTPKHIHPEELNRQPDIRQKQTFLHQLGLAHVMPEKRRRKCLLLYFQKKKFSSSRTSFLTTYIFFVINLCHFCISVYLLNVFVTSNFVFGVITLYSRDKPCVKLQPVKSRNIFILLHCKLLQKIYKLFSIRIQY